MVELTFFDRIGVHKTSESKKCKTCHYWYILGKDFKFKPDVCNGCHNLSMISMKLSDIFILNIKGTAYCCIISGITKGEALQKIDLIK